MHLKDFIESTMNVLMKTTDIKEQIRLLIILRTAIDDQIDRLKELSK